MKAAVLRTPGGLDRIEVHDIPDPGQPGPGQIRIALHASSLNSKDLLVAKGGLPTADRRILMSDGAVSCDVLSLCHRRCQSDFSEDPKASKSEMPASRDTSSSSRCTLEDRQSIFHPFGRRE